MLGPTTQWPRRRAGEARAGMPVGPSRPRRPGRGQEAGLRKRSRCGTRAALAERPGGPGAGGSGSTKMAAILSPKRSHQSLGPAQAAGADSRASGAGGVERGRSRGWPSGAAAQRDLGVPRRSAGRRPEARGAHRARRPPAQHRRPRAAESLRSSVETPRYANRASRQGRGNEADRGGASWRTRRTAPSEASWRRS